MIEKILTKDFVRTGVSASDWKEAIHEGVKPLLEKGYIEERYEEAILENFKELGPYMVIAPGVVLSHARPENGVVQMGMSIVNLLEGVKFGHETNDPVYLVITLAASDNTSHLELLRELMGILMEDTKLHTLKFEKDLQKVLALFHS
ncbi:PTS sugar transporter subunit IIA [Proteiniclasticum ruminis]|jgi:mannitol/fructose-specific phosphotransferase system IIA component (Ntr-type)|uniref:Ascorbate-specific PTS system EIIA component n=1 Tax=Proteiniclasticum ruminis TaxID=398199 RepID=A0A1I4ZX98_9CLOT|nr:PTS sugar transporter subunit IIA [Proteiniclasticum ruminis]SFN54791.1 PTS system IIA component, L-Asc family [Proteiniclasticum ruminis]